MYRRREGVCLEAPALNQLPRLWTEAGKRDVHLLPLPSAHWPPRGSCARPSPNYCRHHQLSGHLPPLPPPLPPPMPSLPVASLPFILISSFSLFLYTSWYSSLIFFFLFFSLSSLSSCFLYPSHLFFPFYSFHLPLCLLPSSPYPYSFSHLFFFLLSSIRFHQLSAHSPLSAGTVKSVKWCSQSNTFTDDNHS